MHRRHLSKKTRDTRRNSRQRFKMLHTVTIGGHRRTADDVALPLLIDFSQLKPAKVYEALDEREQKIKALMDFVIRHDARHLQDRLYVPMDITILTPEERAKVTDGRYLPRAYRALAQSLALDENLLSAELVDKSRRSDLKLLECAQRMALDDLCHRYNATAPEIAAIRERVHGAGNALLGLGMGIDDIVDLALGVCNLPGMEVHHILLQQAGGGHNVGIRYIDGSDYKGPGQSNLSLMPVVPHDMLHWRMDQPLNRFAEQYGFETLGDFKITPEFLALPPAARTVTYLAYETTKPFIDVRPIDTRIYRAERRLQRYKIERNCLRALRNVYEDAPAKRRLDRLARNVLNLRP